MNVKDLTNENNIKKIELVTDYIPYIEKVSQCKSIARTTSHKVIGEGENKREVFVVDSPTRRLFYLMKLVQLYTNIEFKDEEIVSAYDILNKNGVLDVLFGEENSLIPVVELVEWKTIMDMTMDDMYENERSEAAILGGIKESLGMVVGTMIDGIEKAIEKEAIRDGKE